MFRTIFTTLRALLKSGLCGSQLCIRSDTASYVYVIFHRLQFLLFSPTFNPKKSLSYQVWRLVSLCDTQHTYVFIICIFYHFYFSLTFNSKKSLSGQVWRQVSLCDTLHLCLSSDSVVTVESLHCVESIVESTVVL